MVLDIIGLPESTYYYHHQERKRQSKAATRGRPIPGYSWDESGNRICDEQIKEFLMELICGEEEVYGYRKLTLSLRKQYKLIINKKKVHRLCTELNILEPQRRVKPKHPRRLARNRIVHDSNQLWELDIKYVYIFGEDRFCYLMSVIDVYDREIIDYHIGLSCTGVDVINTLQRSLWRRRQFGKQERPVIRTDNGPQFVSFVFEEGCVKFEVEHERIPRKTPNKNAHIESFHAQLEREKLTRVELTTYQDAYAAVSDYIDFYNTRRFHGSLYDLTPVEYRTAVASGKVKPLTVKL